MKKRLIAVLLVAMMTLTACGDATKSTGAAETQPAQAAAATQPSETVAATDAADTAAGTKTADTMQTEYPVTVTDGLGQEVTLEEEPERIISLAPNVTEILFALGLGDKVVGTSEFSDYPAEAAEIETVGGAATGSGAYDFERIAELEPDLVITNGMVEGLAGPMATANVAVVGYYPQSLEDVIAQIGQIAELTDSQEKGQSIIVDMEARKEAVVASVKGLPVPTVFYEVWGDPLMVAGQGSFINEMIGIAGGEDVAGDSLPYSTYDVEQLLEKDPEIYLINDGDPGLTPESVAQRPGYDSLKAVTEDKVLAINADLISRPGPRLIDGLEAVADLLHPTRAK